MKKKPSEDIHCLCLCFTKSRHFTEVCMVVGGGGARIFFLLKRLQQLATFWSYIFVSFQHITFKISIFQTNSKAFFLSRVDGSKSKVKKKLEGFDRIPLRCVGYGFFSVAVAAFLFIRFCFLLASYRRISFIIIYNDKKIKPKDEHEKFALRTIIIKRET